MFIIKSTGARVSIDGSMDLINVVTQKLNTKHKVSKLKETFVHKETPNISFNCSIDLRIGKSEIKQYEDRYFSTKSKARAYSVLKLLENLYEKGFLDDYLNAHTEIFNTKKDSLTKRKKLEKEINTFKEENKGVMKVEGVEFKYIINHDRLNNLNEYSQSVKIIVFLPDKSNEYPFPPSEHSQCIGFLTDKDTLPKSENITLFTKKDQMDRIKHFQNNTQNNDFFSDETAEMKCNASIKPDMDCKVTYSLRIIDVEDMTLEALHKIRFFHVYVYNIIYSSESSFFKGLFHGDWSFGNIFTSALNLVKKDIKDSKIFGEAR